jgi:inosine/xanthosine triphosphatase
MPILKIVVGSLNPVKVNAAKQGFCLAMKLNEQDVDIEGHDVPSGVSDQPIGDEEIKLGATNRARSCYSAFKDLNGCVPYYSIGIEGGIINSGNGTEDEEMECYAWIVVFDGTQFGKSKTASFILPGMIADLIKGGMELGDADDAVFKRINSKQGDGTVGHLTKGVLDRTQFYVQAVVLAMVPFQWPELYKKQ